MRIIIVVVGIPQDTIVASGRKTVFRPIIREHEICSIVICFYSRPIGTDYNELTNTQR